MPTIFRDQLAAALARRARKRKTKKGLQPPRFPRTQELEYMRALKAISRGISALIRVKVFTLLEQPRHDADKPVPTQVLRVIEGLRVQVAERVSIGTAGRMVNQVAEASRKNLNDSYEKVIGVRPWESNDALRGTMAESLRRNVELIRSIGDQQLDQVQQVIQEGWASGARVETIRKQIEERFDVSESRAILIARDQVGKLNAQLNQERQEQIGVTEYTWISSNDERVRPMHAELNGTTHTWRNPPVTNERGERNHPGTDISCRCASVANIEGVLDRLGI